MIKLLEKYIKEQLDNNVWYLNNENKYETIVAKQIEHFITIDVMFYDDDGIIKVKNFLLLLNMRNWLKI